MHQHVCTTMFLNPMMNFNLMKNIIFPIFHEDINSKLNHFYLYFKKKQIFGCYNSESHPRDSDDGDKRDVDILPLDSSLLCIPVNLTPSNLAN